MTILGFFCPGYVDIHSFSRLCVCSCPKVTGSIALTTLNGILATRTSEDLVLTMRLGFASRELYQVCIGTTKLGICAFYLRIFQDRISKVIIRSTMVFVALFTFGLSIGIVFQCRPIDGIIPDHSPTSPNPLFSFSSKNKPANT
jgi:hypothetical protein